MIIKAFYINTFLFVLIFSSALWVAKPMAASEEEKTFNEWLIDFKHEASDRNISKNIIESALDGISPIKRVIELDRSQPESTKTFSEYLNQVVTKGRISLGREKAAKNKPLLQTVTSKFGVPYRFIIALWGIETNFGSYTGGFSVISALATLAYDGRRSEYFRKELLNALEILDQGHIQLESMKGSWAGAMGQSQFMPSSFKQYAIDFNGDGKRDIWNTKADVFASAANYLFASGWQTGETWGREVKLPPELDKNLISLEIKKTLAEWQDLGIRCIDGSDLPAVDMKASIVVPGQQFEGSYLVYENYRVILRWNRSHYFGMAVGRLADAIGYK